VFSKSKIFNFLKRDCGTIPVAGIISQLGLIIRILALGGYKLAFFHLLINGKIEIFSKYQRFLIATESFKYLLIFVLYRDIFLTLNIAHTYSLCSVLKNTGQCMYVIT
jgi:hypothetical protein